MEASTEDLVAPSEVLGSMTRDWVCLAAVKGLVFPHYSAPAAALLRQLCCFLMRMAGVCLLLPKASAQPMEQRATAQGRAHIGERAVSYAPS